MASPEHLAASDFVKSVHEKLRSESRSQGEAQAWVSHCKDEEILKKYATAMHNLASNHWESNCKNRSRVEWVYEYAKIYFCGSEIFKFRRKEMEIAAKMQLKIEETTLDTKEEIQVLDVGSCYNPFQKYKIFNVVPIDIAPATKDVFKCDFLGVHVSNETKIVNSEVLALKSENFDIVIFSLFLEYLPSPAQRYASCRKAYDLLNSEGILFIITPDSKHVGANAKIMKTWRYLLAKLGFSRVKYEKLIHLHCMGFRKSIHLEIAQRWAHLQDKTNFYEEFVIPQDFKLVQEFVQNRENTKFDVMNKWEELPFFPNE